MQDDWLAVLAHELRTPVAAILGYGELIEDGTLGSVDSRTADAARRIGHAAAQIITLINGMSDGSDVDDEPDEEPTVVTARQLAEAAIDGVAFDAAARDTSITIQDGDATLHTRPVFATRSLTLALGAAVKVSHRASLRIIIRDAEVPAISIEGSALDPARDDAPPDSAAPLTGAALRIFFARRTARLVRGRIGLESASTGTLLSLELPRLF